MAHRRWARGVPAVRAGVDCCGTRHTIVWRRGALAAVDHDVAAERAMIALGGDPPACLEILDSWRAAFARDVDTLTVLHNWSAGAGPRTVMPSVLAATVQRMRARGGRLPYAWLASFVVTNAEAVHSRQAYAATVHCLRAHADQPRVVGDALAARAGEAVHASLRATRKALTRMPEVACEASSRVHIDGRAEPGGGEVSVGLRVRWLLDVHARGVAVVDSHLVLDVRDDLGDWLDVVACRWERGTDGASVPVCGDATLGRAGDGSWRVLSASF